MPQEHLARSHLAMQRELPVQCPHGVQRRMGDVSDPSALERALERVRREAQAAMLLPGNTRLFGYRERVVFAARRRLPTSNNRPHSSW